MSKIEAQPTEKIGTIVKNIADLKRGELYRLNIHEDTYGIATPTLRQERFYIPKNETDGESDVLSDKGLVRVVIVGEDDEETESSYRLADLGVVIERSAKVKKSFNNKSSVSEYNGLVKLGRKSFRRRTNSKKTLIQVHFRW